MQEVRVACSDDPILITGSNGFIGTKVVETLLRYGFTNLRCFVRPSGNVMALQKAIQAVPTARVQLIQGNLLSKEHCRQAVDSVAVIIHLAAGIEKTFAGSVLNSVVATRNLLDACLHNDKLKRFVNVSSFAVYSAKNLRRGAVLDESCETEKHPALRHDPYCYGKVKQDQIVEEYGGTHKLPYVIVRPGAVFGPGKRAISGRVGIDTFGIFLHLGGPNRIPFTYVDNCAEAIVLSAIKQGIDGMVINVVDDNLPTSRQFLRRYKKEVKQFRSIYVPRAASYIFCYLWEKYSDWSERQLPPVFNRRRWAADWKGARYSNKRAKELLGWNPRVSMKEALACYFKYQREAEA